MGWELISHEKYIMASWLLMLAINFRCAIRVCKKIKPPEIQEGLSCNAQSVGESNPCYQDENLAS